MILELLLIVALIAVFLFSVKSIFGPNIKEIIRLNIEAGKGDPDLKKLVKIYFAFFGKLTTLIVLLLAITAIIKYSWK